MAVVRLSLAQQIAQLEDAGPVDFDPEDAHNVGVETEDMANADPAAREHYFDVGPSSLRKLHDSVSDPKYEGVKTSRKQLMEDIDGGASEPDDDEPEADVEEESGLDGDGGRESADLPSQSDEESEEETPKSDHVPPKPPTTDQEPSEDLSSTLRKTRDEDRKKGKAVSRQIALWDSLLDARIRMQKTVAASGKLPTSAELQQLTSSSECRESLNKMLEEATLLSDELFELQEHLLTTNESITPPPRKRRKVQSDDDSQPDYDLQLREATQAAAALEHAYHPHLVQTLSKWSSKIQAVAPSVLLPSNRNAFSKNTHHLKSVVQLVDETLADHEKMLARTRVWRGKGTRIGRSAEEKDGEVDPELFDDTDFYQQLLKDIIDARGSNGAGGADDWMVVQKQKKAKKKVDTKASKGRKLRYEVHEKLQNFMVPVPMVGAWHDEQIDELFTSLLGRGFEAVDGLNIDNYAESQQPGEGEAIGGGFRVFG